MRERFLSFIICLKQIFLSSIKFGGHKKDLGVTPHECPPCLRAWAELSSESLPLGTFMFVQGDGDSEHLFLIHKMNSICSLCKLIINIFQHTRIIGS